MRRLVKGVPVCTRGHRVVGRNAFPAVQNGKTYYQCRECRNHCACESRRERVARHRRKT